MAACKTGWYVSGTCVGDLFCNTNHDCSTTTTGTQSTYTQHIYTQCKTGVATECVYDHSNFTTCC